MLKNIYSFIKLKKEKNRKQVLYLSGVIQSVISVPIINKLMACNAVNYTII